MDCIAIVLVVTVLGADQALAARPLPSAMASVGDSITRAFDTGPTPYVDYPPASWSTGIASSVYSHYLRLLAMGAPIARRSYNDAASGAKMADLSAQMAVVNAQHVGYVTVLMGGNDVCASSESRMTSVADFAIQFRIAMKILQLGSPRARAYVVSIPDIYRLWAILKDDPVAQLVWTIAGICQSMLANPQSMAPADVLRRLRVRQRNIEFNAVMKWICENEYASTCRFDGNADFNTPFTTADVSTRDYFHPSLDGQAKLAAVTWAAGYWGNARTRFGDGDDPRD
jgi:lysophospholipase L1-like esterase